MKNIILFIFICVFAIPSFASKYFIDARGAYAALEDAKKVNQRIVALNSLDVVVQTGLFDKITKRSKIVFVGDYWEVLDGKIIFVTKNVIFAELFFDNQKLEDKIVAEVAKVIEEEILPSDPFEQVSFLFSYIENIEENKKEKEVFEKLLKQEGEEFRPFKNMVKFILDEFDSRQEDCFRKKNCCITSYGIQPMIEKFYNSSNSNTSIAGTKKSTGEAVEKNEIESINFDIKDSILSTYWKVIRSQLPDDPQFSGCHLRVAEHIKNKFSKEGIIKYSENGDPFLMAKEYNTEKNLYYLFTFNPKSSVMYIAGIRRNKKFIYRFSPNETPSNLNKKFFEFLMSETS